MTMKTYSLLPVLALSAAAGFSTLAQAQDAPDPSQTYIKEITAIGTGCPEGSYNVNLAPDRKAFSLAFGSFIAQLGPGLPLAESRKNCSITLTLNVPAGWQYSIGSFNYRGYMDVAPAVMAEHSTNYFFQGTGQTGRFLAQETGPIQKDFTYTDKVGLTSVYIPDTWSPCNTDRALTINPSVRLAKLAGYDANSESFITNDTADGEITQVFGLAWRKCGQTPPPAAGESLPAGLKVGEEYQFVAKHSGACLDVFNHGLNNGDALQQWACTGEPHQKFKIVNRGAAGYSLVGVQSGKTLSVESSYQHNGAKVIQWDNQDALNQALVFKPAQDGAFTVSFKHSNKCLDVSGSNLNSGGAVHQWDCGSSANQQWYVRPAKFIEPGAVYQLVSRHSGKCLDVFDHSLDNGTHLQQWACTGEPHQKFRVVDHKEGLYSLVGLQSGKTVTALNGSNDNGAPVVQQDFANTWQQKLHIVPLADGSYALRFAHSKKCLDVSGPSKDDGARVHQWECGQNAANQDWIFRKQ